MELQDPGKTLNLEGRPVQELEQLFENWQEQLKDSTPEVSQLLELEWRREYEKQLEQLERGKNELEQLRKCTKELKQQAQLLERRKENEQRKDLEKATKEVEQLEEGNMMLIAQLKSQIQGIVASLLAGFALFARVESLPMPQHDVFELSLA